jgi:hypothetical protein
MTKKGTCETCPKFSNIAADKKSCTNPNCLNVAGKNNTTEDGVCVADGACPSYTKLSVDGKKQCVATDCSADGASKFWVGMDGACYATG